MHVPITLRAVARLADALLTVSDGDGTPVGPDRSRFPEGPDQATDDDVQRAIERLESDTDRRN